MPGEILVKKNEFYDYEAKYAEGGMELSSPPTWTRSPPRYGASPAPPTKP